MERNKKESAKYRQANADKFKQIGTGPNGPVFGGYQPGVINGPEPTTKRGKGKTNCKWG